MVPKYSRLSLMKKEAANSIVNNCNVFTENDIEEEIVEIAVDPIFYIGSVIGQGSLSDSFKITLHLDNSYSDTAITVVIGETLFTKINWTNSIAGMKFYIDKCTYACGGFSVDIIKVRYDGDIFYTKFFLFLHQKFFFKPTILLFLHQILKFRKRFFGKKNWCKKFGVKKVDHFLTVRENIIYRHIFSFLILFAILRTLVIPIYSMLW